MNRINTLAFYKRTVFLINRPFQLKFSLIVTSIVLITTSVYPFIIYDFFNILTLQKTQIPQNVIAAQKEMIFYLMIIQTIIALLVFIFFIFVGHKIAGPIFNLKRHLHSIREGHPISPITFRSGDYFNDLAEEVTQFMDVIIKNQENDFAYINEIADYIENLSSVVPDDKKPVLTEISRRLLEIQNRYKKS